MHAWELLFEFVRVALEFPIQYQLSANALFPFSPVVALTWSYRSPFFRFSETHFL